MLNYKMLLVWCSCRDGRGGCGIPYTAKLKTHLFGDVSYPPPRWLSQKSVYKKNPVFVFGVVAWCMHVCVPAYVMSVCVYGGQRTISDIGSHALPTLLLEAESVTWPRAPRLDEAGCLVNPKDLLISTPCLAFSHGCWELNSGPQACVANTWLTKLYLQPCFLKVQFFFYWLFLQCILLQKKMPKWQIFECQMD